MSTRLLGPLRNQLICITISPQPAESNLNDAIGVTNCRAGVSKGEVLRVLFLGMCLDFYYYLRRVLLPQFGFYFDGGSVSQALVEPSLVPP